MANRQTSILFPLEQMPTVLNAVDHRLDTWLSQAEFMRPNRRVVNLLRIGLLFADLDTYKMPWAQGRKPEELAAAITYFASLKAYRSHPSWSIQGVAFRLNGYWKGQYLAKPCPAGMLAKPI